MIPALVLVVVAIVLAIGVAIVEGGVIVRCLGAPGRGGARRLDRLGAGFLASEVWTVALLGTVHGAFPGLSHAAGPLVAAPALVALAGWMLRDLGLWLGPRLGAGAGWRVVVAIGAGVQGAGMLVVVGVLALAAATGAVPLPPDPSATASPLALGLLASVLPVALGVGAVL